MPVPTLDPERVLRKLRAGTCVNIQSVLTPGLTRAAFIRLAVDEKIAQLRRDAGIGVVTTANQPEGEEQREPLPAPSLPWGASFSDIRDETEHGLFHLRRMK